MNYLLIILICSGIFALLVVLYVLSHRSQSSPLFGDSAAFPFILVARPLVKLQWFVEDAALAFRVLCQKSMTYPPGVTNETWYGLGVIARNILFLVCSIISTGELAINLQRLPILFAGAGSVDLGVAFAIPSALLFALISALYGYVGLDCAGVTPYSTHIFPRMNDEAKKWLGRACLVGFILATVFAVSFWAYSGYYLSHPPTGDNVFPDNSDWMVISILALVGLLLSGSFVLSLFGIIVGLTGVCTLVFALLYCVFTIVAGAFSLIPSMLDVAVLYLTDGRKSVYGKFIGHDTYKVPSSPFPASGGSSPSQTLIAALSDPASVVLINPPETMIAPISDPDEKKTSRKRKNGVLRKLEIKWMKELLPPLPGEQETIEHEQSNGNSQVNSVEPVTKTKIVTNKTVTPSSKSKAPASIPVEIEPSSNGHMNTASKSKTNTRTTKNPVSASKKATTVRRGRPKTTKTKN